ncbi:hypothetical protein AG1IA_10467 [Rhizoctonia solani AG-1 IA]|uniref:Uncharacterized protein n=1 Tax=Thanatephorus cucumeris (strain AG1-IA) TaxID=983506 RepID=L8WFE2_THACA|nr:hypothetical protein AG1IA_10467 [Rhizoctonia solani AG-1 IA]
MIPTRMRAKVLSTLNNGNDGSTEQMILSSRRYSLTRRESLEAKTVGSRRRCASISSFIRVLMSVIAIGLVANVLRGTWDDRGNFRVWWLSST